MGLCLGAPASGGTGLRFRSTTWLLEQTSVALAPQLLPRSLTLAEGPSGDRRLTVMLAETGIGASALLAEGIVAGTLDVVLLALVRGSSDGPSSGSSLSGVGIAVLELAATDVLAVPFIAAGAAYQTSHLFGDQGGHFWHAVLAALLAEVLVDGPGFSLVAWEAGVFSASSGHLGAQPVSAAGIVATDIAFAAIHLVAIPLAASIGLHFGQQTVPQTQLPAAEPSSPALAPPPSATEPTRTPSTLRLLLPVLTLRFG